MSSQKSTSGSSGKSSRKPVELKKIRSDAPSPVRDPSRRRSSSGPGGEQENEEESEEQGEIRKPSGEAYATEGSENSEDLEENEEEPEEFRQYRPSMEENIRAKTYPQFKPSDLFRYYNAVLKVCPIAEWTVQHAFDPAVIQTDPDIPLKAFSRNRYDALRKRYKSCGNVHRTTLDFFFGALPKEGLDVDPLQCHCMEKFLSDKLTDYQRELILFTILVDFYKRSVEADEERTRAREWEETIGPIEAMASHLGTLPDLETVRAADSDFQLTVQQLDLHEKAIYEIEAKPYWPVYVAFWWLAKNNELFRGSKGLRKEQPFGKGMSFTHRRIIRSSRTTGTSVS